jgi:EamA-like transporter family
MDAPHRHYRFIALSGMFFSLQHLSLSDAVVIKFIEPIITGFLGAIFLKESLSLKEILAGCMLVGRSHRDRNLCGVSFQLFWSPSDCQASISIRWSPRESV